MTSTSGVPFFVGRMRIGFVLQQELNRLRVTEKRGVEERCCSFIVRRLHRCASVNQRLRNFRLPHGTGDVQRRVARARLLLVDVSSRSDILFDCINVAVSCRVED